MYFISPHLSYRPTLTIYFPYTIDLGSGDGYMTRSIIVTSSHPRHSYPNVLVTMSLSSSSLHHSDSQNTQGVLCTQSFHGDSDEGADKLCTFFKEDNDRGLVLLSHQVLSVGMMDGWMGDGWRPSYCFKK